MRETADEDFLKIALRQLSRQLMTLELDPFVGSSARDQALIPHVLEIPSGSTMQLLPAVRMLYLSSVSLKGATQDIVHALN